MQIANLLFNLVPEAGTLVPSDSQAKFDLEKVVDKNNELKRYAQSIASANSELGFWGASLTQDSAVEYIKLMDSINEYLTSLHYLHNCPMNLYVHKTSDNTIQQWKTRFKSRQFFKHAQDQVRRKRRMHSYSEKKLPHFAAAILIAN